MRFYVGTSGYSYAPWKGPFYPEKLPASKMLGYYATRLPAVEINNTFYRMPGRELVSKWGDEVPGTFRFALKAPQRITHQKRLVDCDELVRQFRETSGVLGEKLGPTLFQLPPFFRKDLPKLESFLAGMSAAAPGMRATFEFRHPSWFEPEVYESLSRAGVALCIAEDEKLATPLQKTAPFGYLRLRRQDYAEPEVAGWADRIAAQGWQECYVFFKHEDEGKGPALAEQLIARLPREQDSAVG